MLAAPLPSRRLLLLLAFALPSAALFSGCAVLIPQSEEIRQNRPADLPPAIELTEVPFFPQKEFECGPASLASSLVYFGAQVTPEELADQVYLPERKGSLQVEMLSSARRNGMVGYQIAPSFLDMLREVAGGIPVIVLMDFGVWPISVWHYAVIVGYDMDTSDVIVRSGVNPRVRMPYGLLEYLWKESKYWAIVTPPPGRIPVTATEPQYLKAVVALEQTGKKKSAREAYASMLVRWPESLGAGIGLANADYALGDLKQAESVLRGVVEKHPDQAVAYNNLAQTLSDQGRDAEALPLAERAVALGGPHAAAARETLEAISRRLKAQESSAAERKPGT
jgi:Peptidase_C39 like family/Tetratricopeptide repeat